MTPKERRARQIAKRLYNVIIFRCPSCHAEFDSLNELLGHMARIPAATVSSDHCVSIPVLGTCHRSAQ